MKKMILFIGFICFAFSVNGYGQIEIKATKTILAKKQLSQLDESLKSYSIFTINDVERFFPAEGEAKVLMKLGNEFLWDLDLEDNNSLFAADYKATMMTENGEIELPKPDIKLFKSKDPDNLTRLAIYDGIINGIIDRKSEKYHIRPLSDFDRNDKESVVVYKEKDIKKNVDQFEYDDILHNELQENVSTHIQTRSLADFTNTIRTLKLATDADSAFYNDLRVYTGRDANAVIAAEINKVEAKYYAAFNIKIRIVEQNVWKDKDIYRTTSPKYYLDNFRNYWITEKRHVNRNFTILFTSNNYIYEGSGLSYGAGTIGKYENQAYAWVRAWDYFDGTTAHELAHGFGATDNPPSSGCGTSDATLMCHNRSKSSAPFSNYTINQIKTFISDNDKLEKYFVPSIHYISGYTAFGPGSQGDYTAYPSYDNNPDITYEWRVNGGLISRSNNSSIMSYIFNRAGTYTITCKATNTKGNISGSQASLSVQVINGMNVQSITLPTDFFQIVMPNENELIVSKASGEKEYIQNMNSDKISYQVNNALTGVLATLGTVVNGGSINTSNIPKGIYVITLTSTDGHTESHKISIQ